MSSIQTQPARIAALARELDAFGYDALFATTPISMGYLHGFFEGGHERFLTLAVRSTGETRLICPALSETQARRAGIHDIRPWRDDENPLEIFASLAEEWDLRSGILAVDDEMTARILLQMQEVLPAALFKPGQAVLSRLMRHKEEAELRHMREAGRIADEALPAALAAIRPGATEIEVSEALSAAMRKAGGKPTFCIVATGANGAEPHHLTDATRIREGDIVVLDYGCDVDGYQSDITRTVSCGKASDKAKKVYEIVLAAHYAARRGVKPGTACEQIDALARAEITDAGYGAQFVHRTGHGIGMRVHEEPYIVSGNETPLEVGDCFSVEPGIYLPGEFGVRIENIVTVTAGGESSLNAEPSATILEA